MSESADTNSAEGMCGMESAAPKAKASVQSAAAPFKFSRSIRICIMFAAFAGVSVLLSFGAANGAYSRKRDAEIPSRRIALDDPVSGMEAVSLVIGSISAAKKEIVACLPIQYAASQQVFKLLGKKAREGVRIVVVMHEGEKNFLSAKEYLEYYGGGKVVIAGLSQPVYTTTFLLDAVYAIKIGAPMGSSMGKAPVCGSLELYANPAMVAEQKRIMASVQGADD